MNSKSLHIKVALEHAKCRPVGMSMRCMELHKREGGKRIADSNETIRQTAHDVIITMSQQR